MKKLKYKLIAVTSISLVFIVYACNKNFLDKTPIGTVSDPSVLANKNGVDGLLLGAYSLVDGEGGNNSGWGSAASNWVYGSVSADDAYKGSTPSDQGDIVPLETWTATATNSYPSQKWNLCYDGVQRCNEVLRVMRLATDLTAADTTQFAAEARFLRGFFLFELKKVFNNVPFIDESVTSTTSDKITNVNGGGYVDIWPQIEAEFTYAMTNLPLKQDQVGRANKGAAMAYLAKVYMFEKKYSQAKPLLDALINNTGGVGVTAGGLPYGLDSYENNFNPATKNGKESVFAAQMSVNDGSGNAQGNGQGVANGNYGDVLNFPYNNGPGACCGFFNPSQSLANSYKTDPSTGLPLLDGSFNSGTQVGDNTYSGTLDPRIDWVMGRPGLPYFDWGNQPTDDSWIRDPGNDGRFTGKKSVYAKSQKGTFSSTENYWANSQLVANNVNLIRYADVLLWAAECDVQLGTDIDKALTYVNLIRTRASDKTGWVYAGGATYNAGNSTYSPQTTPAANYFIKAYPTGAFANKTYALNAIMFERKIELGMEGHRFFDLVRWGTAAATLNAYATFERAKRSAFNGVSFTAGKSEYFPIPQNQIDILNANGTANLKQNPGY